MTNFEATHPTIPPKDRKRNLFVPTTAPSKTKNSSKIYDFQDLFKAGLYDSCFFLMNVEKQNNYFESAAENILYADLLVKKCQTVYSLKYFERGIRMIPTDNLESSWAVAAMDRYLDKCLEAGEYYKAKQFIESAQIQELKSIKRLKQMASVYDHFGEIKNAIEVYKNIVKLQPLAVEAVKALINYGCSAKELKVLEITDPVVSKYSGGLLHLQAGSFPAAMDSFKTILSDSNGTNVQELALVAHVQRKAGDAISAIHTYSRIRRLDPCWIQDMDYYAVLLESQGNASAIEKISNDLFSLANNSPESWLVFALFTNLKGNAAQALDHLDKALLLDNRHSLAYQQKGKIILQMGNPSEASACFRNAYRISRDIANYEGLVTCYISLGKIMEATSTAKEALALLPLCARAVCLAGVVMKENSTLHNKAREYFDRALKMDPKAIEPLYAISDLYIKQDNLSKAIQILQDNLSLHHTDSIHVRLGDLYSRLADYPSANQHYNSALLINPECLLAKRGLNEVERLVNGGDDEVDLESAEEEEM